MRPFRTLLAAAAALLGTACLAQSAEAPAAGALQAADEAAHAQLVAMLRGDAERHQLGQGVERDGAFAAALYCRAARLGDAESLFQLGWAYAYGRGVERNDGWAAYLFQAAAERGIAQAPNMLRLVGSATPRMPECLREPAPPPLAAAPEPPPFEDTTAATRTLLLLSAPRRVVELVKALAPQYRVPPELALAVIQAESNFDSTAVSPKNAMGLMQLIPETAERFRVRDPFDPRQNIQGGLAYLRWLLAYFEGNVELVAAAYNAGEGAVDRHLGVPPYEETRAYVRRIVASVGRAVQPFDARITAPSSLLPRMRRQDSAAR